MKSNKELEQDILKITLKIGKEFPELSKYLEETPQNNFGINTNKIDSVNLKEYYNSLNEMLATYSNTHIAKELHGKPYFPGYPLYSPALDIYNKSKKEQDMDIEDPSKRKSTNAPINTSNEKSFEDDHSGDDLDVPGSELDDLQESIGNEDEENNYYSLGGDNHNDLEEDNG